MSVVPCRSVTFVSVPLIVAILAPPAAARWVFEDLTTDRLIGASFKGSSGFTASGQPAVAYGGASLYYAEWNGSNWDIETIQSRGCNDALDDPSLAFDSNGRAAVAFRDQKASTIHYATRGPSGWSVAGSGRTSSRSARRALAGLR